MRLSMRLLRKEEGYVRDRDDYSADLEQQEVCERPLTRREQKQKEKLERQAMEIRRKQEASGLPDRPRYR